VKVALVSTLPSGGPVSHLRYLAPRLLEIGVDVEVVCGTEALQRTFAESGVRARVVPLTNKYDIRGARALAAALEVDVVHTHDRRAGLYGRLLARARGARVVHTFHGLPEEIAVRLGRPGIRRSHGVTPAREAWLLHGYLGLERLLIRLGMLVVPSHTMADFLRERGFPNKRLRVIPSGIDVRRTEPRPPHDPYVLGTAAIIHPLKGTDLLIDACALARLPLRLEVYGSGEWLEPMRARAARLGVNATFHGEIGDARAAIEALDGFVLPSRAENLPISLLEAMASAVPVIATRVGGVLELVEDGVNGLVVPAEDPDALGVAIDSLIADPRRRAELARAGAATVAEHFESTAVAHRLAQLYTEIHSGTPALPGRCV